MSRPEEVLGVPGEPSLDASTDVWDHIGGGLGVPGQESATALPEASIDIDTPQPVDPTGPPVTAPPKLAEKPPEPTGDSDRIKEADEAFRKVCQLIDSKEQLALLSDETKAVVKDLINTLESKIKELIGQGANASASQVLVVVLAWSGTEDGSYSA